MIFFISIVNESLIIEKYYRIFECQITHGGDLNSITAVIKKSPIIINVTCVKLKAISLTQIKTETTTSKTYVTEYAPKELLNNLYKFYNLYKENNFPLHLKEVFQFGIVEEICRLLKQSTKFDFSALTLRYSENFKQIIKDNLLEFNGSISIKKVILSISEKWFLNIKQVSDILIDILKEKPFLYSAAEALGILGYASKDVKKILISMIKKNKELIEEGDNYIRGGCKIMSELLIKDDCLSYYSATSSAKALVNLLLPSEINDLLSDYSISETIKEILKCGNILKFQKVVEGKDIKQSFGIINLDDIESHMLFNKDYENLKQKIMQQLNIAPEKNVPNVVRSLLKLFNKKNISFVIYGNLLNLSECITLKWPALCNDIISIILRDCFYSDCIKEMHALQTLRNIISVIPIHRYEEIFNNLKKITKNTVVYLAPLVLAEFCNLSLLKKTILIELEKILNKKNNTQQNNISLVNHPASFQRDYMKKIDSKDNESITERERFQML